MEPLLSLTSFKDLALLAGFGGGVLADERVLGESGERGERGGVLLALYECLWPDESM